MSGKVSHQYLIGLKTCVLLILICQLNCTLSPNQHDFYAKTA